MKLTIGTKLLGGFMMVAALVAFAAIMGISKVSLVDEETHIIVDDRVPQYHAAMRLQILQKACRVNMLELSLVRDRMDQWDIYKKGYQEKAKEFEEWCQAVLHGSEELGVKACQRGGRIEAYTKDVQGKFAVFKDVSEELIGYKKHLLEQVVAGKISASENLTDDGLKKIVREDLLAASKDVEIPIDSMEKRAEEQMKHAEEIADNTASSAQTGLLIVLFAAVGLAIGIGILISRSITKPVAQLRDASLEMAQGNTNVQIDVTSKDEIGELADAFQQMGENVRSVVNDIGKLAQTAVAGDLDARADENSHHGDFRKIVHGVNNTLDAVIEPISESIGCLEEVSMGDLQAYVKGDYKGDHAKMKNSLNATLDALNDTLGQVAVAVDQISSGSQQVSESSQAVSQGATEQASSLEETTSSMTEMSSQTKQNAENASQANQLSSSARDAADKGDNQMEMMLAAMGEINNSSDQISRIIKVIDEIAFQTNLLALNAAVEAARAGVHGKGFAVVAEEVRNLAQRSAKAASETTELIEGSVERVGNGTKIAHETAKALKDIIVGITKATDLVAEIASASKEQVQGIGQVNEALGQIDQVTQSNTASAEESASASEELSSQAVQLKQMIGRFKLKNNGNGGFQANAVKSAQSQPEWQEQDDQDWGGNGGNGKNQRNKKTKAAKANKIRSADVIALDDNEFGDF